VGKGKYYFDLSLYRGWSVPKINIRNAGGLVFTRKPASHISLILLLPGSPKSLIIDLGTHVHIPMLSIQLNRDYFVDSTSLSYTKGGLFISLYSIERLNFVQIHETLPLG
jgi:hypothetical protein